MKHKHQVAQAKIELLHDDLGCNVSQLQVQLDCAIAMIYAGDTVGTIYSLRRSKAIWRAISRSAGTWSRPMLNGCLPSDKGSEPMSAKIIPFPKCQEFPDGYDAGTYFNRVWFTLERYLETADVGFHPRVKELEAICERIASFAENQDAAWHDAYWAALKGRMRP
jgi:hypothetical protein